jgi:hypothetical protein
MTREKIVPLNNFSEDLQDHDLGDWMELSVLRSAAHSLSFPDLQRQIGIMGEDDGEDADLRAEETIQRLNEIIQDRMQRVGVENYPFEYTEDGNRLVLKELVDSSIVYVFCLLLSHTKRDDVLNGSYTPNIDDSIRRSFQGCSTVAAAGLVQGNAIWFGFPRPDKSGFLAKLRATYELICDGTPVEVAIAGTSPSPKDEEIDIIAWSKREDTALPAYYMLAQVASGNNWDVKSIKGQPIHTFHRNWFNTAPACEPQAAMFMPMLFPLYTGATLDQQLQILFAQFGQFLYRFSIPRYYQRGLRLAADHPNLVIEGRECMPAIAQWVTDERAKLSAA